MKNIDYLESTSLDYIRKQAEVKLKTPQSKKLLNYILDASYEGLASEEIIERDSMQNVGYSLDIKDAANIKIGVLSFINEHGREDSTTIIDLHKRSHRLLRKKNVRAKHFDQDGIMLFSNYIKFLNDYIKKNHEDIKQITFFYNLDNEVHHTQIKIIVNTVMEHSLKMYFITNYHRRKIYDVFAKMGSDTILIFDKVENFFHHTHTLIEGRMKNAIFKYDPSSKIFYFKENDFPATNHQKHRQERAEREFFHHHKMRTRGIIELAEGKKSTKYDSPDIITIRKHNYNATPKSQSELFQMFKELAHHASNKVDLDQHRRTLIKELYRHYLWNQEEDISLIETIIWLVYHLKRFESFDDKNGQLLNLLLDINKESLLSDQITTLENILKKSTSTIIVSERDLSTLIIKIHEYNIKGRYFSDLFKEISLPRNTLALENAFKTIVESHELRTRLCKWYGDTDVSLTNAVRIIKELFFDDYQ